MTFSTASGQGAFKNTDNIALQQDNSKHDVFEANNWQFFTYLLQIIADTSNFIATSDNPQTKSQSEIRING